MAFNRAQLFAAFALGLLLMANGAEAVGFCYCRSRLYTGGCADTDTDSEHCAKACRQERISDGFCDDIVHARGPAGPRCICAGECDEPPPPVVQIPEWPPLECGVSN